MPDDARVERIAAQAASGGVPATSGYRDVIVRAAADPNFNIEKLERLVRIQEELDKREAERKFNEEMSAAQAEMQAVSADASNPVTRSRYASYAKLDHAIRPIYTRHRFSISFNTEPSGEPNRTRVVGLVANGAYTRKHQVDIPYTTTGFRGGEMMTPTHAYTSSISYGERALLAMIFNIAVLRDDDGNRASGASARAPPSRGPPPTQESPVDPQTGEVSPHEIQFLYDENGNREPWPEWGARMIAALLSSKTLKEKDQWALSNKQKAEDCKREAPIAFAKIEAASNKHGNKLKAEGQTQ